MFAGTYCDPTGRFMPRLKSAKPPWRTNWRIIYKSFLRAFWPMGKSASKKQRPSERITDSEQFIKLT